MSVWAVILAGGSGKRMGAGENKIFLPVLGVPAIVRSVRPFTALCDGIVLTSAPGEGERLHELMHEWQLEDRISAIVPGGRERQDSVANGLAALPEDAEYVMIHDGARCLVTQQVITDALESARLHGSGIAAIPLKDTVKKASPEGLVSDTPDRASLYAVQTPQTFRVSLLREAHRQAAETGWYGTDDAGLLEKAGMPVWLSRGSDRNLKLTTPVDLTLAELLLAQDRKEN